MSLPHATKLVTRVARYASFPRSVAVQMQDGIELYCMRKKVWAARQAEHKVRGNKNTKVPPPGLFADVTNALPRRQELWLVAVAIARIRTFSTPS